MQVRTTPETQRSAARHTRTRPTLSTHGWMICLCTWFVLSANLIPSSAWLRSRKQKTRNRMDIGDRNNNLGPSRQATPLSRCDGPGSLSHCHPVRHLDASIGLNLVEPQARTRLLFIFRRQSVIGLAAYQARHGVV